MEQRSAREQDCILRQKQLENFAKASQEKFEEITRGWTIVSENVHFSELQRARDSQKQLCAALVEDKRKFIRAQQQESRVKNDQVLKMLQRRDTEINLMLERMEEQFKNLTKAYREELAQIQRVCEQENLLIKDKAELSKHMKEHFDRELERVMERRKEVEESEKAIHNLMLETTNKISIMQIEENVKSQVEHKKQQQMKSAALILRLKQIRDLDKEMQIKATLDEEKCRILSVSKKAEKLKSKFAELKATFKKRSHFLSKVYTHYSQQHERIQKEVKHAVVADIRRFEEMWVTLEEEVTQLAEKALAIDFLICKQHLGLAWECPSATFMESPGPISSQKHATSPTRQLFQASDASQCSQGMMDSSVGPDLETDSEDGAGVEQGKLSSETLMKVMELLCDETGFLVESKLLNLLPTLEKREQFVVKLYSLFSALGLEEKDVPKLAEFLLNYEHQQRAQTEGVFAECSEMAEAVETSATADTASELIHPNHVLPALKSFLEQYRKESSAYQHSSLGSPEASDTSVNDAYWNSLGNIISEDRLKLWDVVKRKLNQYEKVLMEISESDPETEPLRQENTELRMELQQMLSSTLEV
ncbi:dynein regulatory complex protein 1 isoform X2 [Archocentrus centrarchus]|nr:dynein regulatory complex protein 1 isoform X2 [Archocentrus centrarchus]